MVEDEMSFIAGLLKRQRDHRLMIVWIGFLPEERVDKTPRGFHLGEGTAEVERFPFRRLHRDSVAPSGANVELDLRRGESSGAPPLRELLGFYAGLEHTLARRGEVPLEM
jgi:hypothetical protein